jgi:hypothetical protein
MKPKILLTFFILVCCVNVLKAQIQSGKILVGGSVSYSTSTDPEQHYFSANVQVGKVLKGNSVVGIIGSYSSNNNNYTASFQNKTRSAGAGVFYRKYKELGHKFYVFGELNTGYSLTKNNMEYYNSASQYLYSKSDLISMYFIPGISYTFCKKMQIELSMPNIAYISYSHSSTLADYLPASVSPQKKNYFNANANLNTNLLNNFGIGFKFFL